MEKNDQEEAHEEEKDNDDDDEERPEGEICITDFEDLKTYRDIPDFKNFPTWLQEMIKEFKTVFTNQLSKHSIMNVKPATFTLKKNVEIKDNNLTAHFPPANLRESADRLLDKLEQGGLIKKAPRVTRYKSKAFFKAKKNNEARLLIDYKASQVNELLERPTHPQFSVEQVVQQVKPGNEYFLSADITGAFFCHPLQEGPEGGDVTTFLTHRGKYFFTVLPQGCKVSQVNLAPFLVRARRCFVSWRSTLLKEAREVAQPKNDFTCLHVWGRGNLLSPAILSGSGVTPSFEITTPAKLMCEVLNRNFAGFDFTLNSLQRVKRALHIFLKVGRFLQQPAISSMILMTCLSWSSFRSLWSKASERVVPRKSCDTRQPCGRTVKKYLPLCVRKVVRSPPSGPSCRGWQKKAPVISALRKYSFPGFTCWMTCSTENCGCVGRSSSSLTCDAL